MLSQNASYDTIPGLQCDAEPHAAEGSADPVVAVVLLSLPAPASALCVLLLLLRFLFGNGVVGSLGGLRIEMLSPSSVSGVTRNPRSQYGAIGLRAVAIVTAKVPDTAVA